MNKQLCFQKNVTQRFTKLLMVMFLIVTSSSVVLADLIDYFQPMPIYDGLESNAWGAGGVLPRDIHNGIEDPDWSYWGGSIIKGNDGKYHMFPCRWPERNGHRDYSNSVVVHAVSDTPTGPFISQGNAYTWNSGKGHNPEVIRLTDGRLAMHLGAPQDGNVLIADTVWGPWVHQGRITIDTNGYSTKQLTYNMTAVIRPDGSIIILSRHGNIMLSNNGIMGPYVVQGNSVYPYHLYDYTPNWEDPFIWRIGDEYHLVVNDWKGREAIHMTSPDGIDNWEYMGLAFNPFDITRYVDGTETQWYKMERPKALIEDGHITHFNFAVIDVPKGDDTGNDGNSSKNIVIPFDGMSFDKKVTSPPTEPPAPTPAPTPLTLCGDVDSSGEIDIVDALLIAQYYVDLNPANFNFAAADVSGDKAIDIVDALLVAQYYVQLIGTLEGCEPSEPVTYELQAEDGTWDDAVVENDHSGYTGTGYVNTANASGRWIEWPVNTLSGGSAICVFTYAHESGDRPMDLSINNSIVTNLSFPASGAWATWSTQTTTVNLMSGSNAIRLTATSATGAPNLDKMDITITGE